MADRKDPSKKITGRAAEEPRERNEMKLARETSTRDEIQDAGLN